MTGPQASDPARSWGNQAPQSGHDAHMDAPDAPLEGGRSEEVYMAVHSGGGRVGVAWYNESLGEMRCFEGAEESTSGALSSHRLVQLARLHAMPSIIYVSSKAPADLIAALKEPLYSSISANARMEQVEVETRSSNIEREGGHGALGKGAGNSPENNSQQECEVRMQRSKLFSPGAARAWLEAVHVDGMSPDLGPRERLHVINTMVSLAREQQIIAAGALLAVLAQDGILGSGSINDTTSSGTIYLASLQEVSLDGHLLVDPGSLEALSIFHLDAHPSSMGLGRAKEGLSVFGVLNRCVTAPGRSMLRMWFARPLVNLEALEERMDGVDALVRHPDESKALKSILRAVRDPLRVLGRLQSLQTLPSMQDFLALQSSLAALLRLRDALYEIISHNQQQQQQQPSNSVAGTGAHGTTTSSPLLSPGAITIFSRLAAAISDQLVEAHQLVAGVFDPGQIPESMSIHYGVSQDLDDLKALYYGLPDLLKQVEQHEVSRLPHTLAAQISAQGTWSVVYLPQLGFLLQVEGGLLGADVLESMPDIELAFEGGGGGGGGGGALGALEEGAAAGTGSAGVGGGGVAGACYHTATTRDLTDRYGDVLLKIRDMETAICNQVAQRLSGHARAVRAASASSAELDCLLSLAEAAIELRLSRPKLTTDNSLVIKGGRHLLAEMVTPNMGDFIPNNTTMGSDSGRIHIITGPNFSGKSVYAKQVAIIVFLAHVGSFVPADEAVVGLTDRIFTRVATRECGAVPQSTFMIDLSQVAAMLRLATPRSLLIIDEFGKGTLAADGVGLLCGALGHLAAKDNPPRVVLTTHFTEVLNPVYLPRVPNLAFYTMAVLLEGGEIEEEGHIEGGGVGFGAVGDRVRGMKAPPPPPPPSSSSLLARPRRRNGLTFLYRLTKGQAAPSFGVQCAELAGVDQSVVDRAESVIACISRGRAVEPAVICGMKERGAMFEHLVARLLGVDVGDAVAVKALLAEVKQTVEAA